MGKHAAVFVLCLFLLSVGCGGGASTGCNSDKDCKGDRICSNGACVAPPAGSPTPVAAVNKTDPSTTPSANPTPAPDAKPFTSGDSCDRVAAEYCKNCGEGSAACQGYTQMMSNPAIRAPMTDAGCTGMIQAVQTVSQIPAEKEKLCSLNPMTGQSTPTPNAATPTTPPVVASAPVDPAASPAAPTAGSACTLASAKQTCNASASDSAMQSGSPEGWVGCAKLKEFSKPAKEIEAKLAALQAEFDKCASTAGSADMTVSFDGNKVKVKPGKTPEPLATCLKDALKGIEKSVLALNNNTSWIGGDGDYYKMQLSFSCGAP